LLSKVWLQWEYWYKATLQVFLSVLSQLKPEPRQ
jgi:hypothetical protein